MSAGWFGPHNVAGRGRTLRRSLEVKIGQQKRVAQTTMLEPGFNLVRNSSEVSPGAQPLGIRALADVKFSINWCMSSRRESLTQGFISQPGNDTGLPCRPKCLSELMHENKKFEQAINTNLLPGTELLFDRLKCGGITCMTGETPGHCQPVSRGDTALGAKSYILLEA